MSDLQRHRRVHVNLPKWGMGIDEGTVTRWLKSVGDRVTKGEAIVEIETAKATQEVEAPANGTLREILLAAGKSALVNTPIAVIEEDDG
jgi:pyruvate/2-oxoglutarate dehydrogenase complex dihydrolipoamide acyltransferase (E2) component